MQLQAIIINDVLMGILIITPLKVGVLLLVIIFLKLLLQSKVEGFGIQMTLYFLHRWMQLIVMEWSSLSLYG